MKPLWKNGSLLVELHKPEIALLEKARELGKALSALHQPTGEPLIAAINKILNEEEMDV